MKIMATGSPMFTLLIYKILNTKIQESMKITDTGLQMFTLHTYKILMLSTMLISLNYKTWELILRQKKQPGFKTI